MLVCLGFAMFKYFKCSQCVIACLKLDKADWWIIKANDCCLGDPSLLGLVHFQSLRMSSRLEAGCYRELLHDLNPSIERLNIYSNRKAIIRIQQTRACGISVKMERKKWPKSRPCKSRTDNATLHPPVAAWKPFISKSQSFDLSVIPN